MPLDASSKKLTLDSEGHASPVSFVMLALWSLIFIAGATIGGAAVGLFWWAYATTVHEAAVTPLADLGMREESLTREDVDSYVRQLGGQYHNQDAACMEVAVVVGDDDRYFSFGKRPSGARPDKDTIFELASVGKTFTGLLLADMIQRGEVCPTTTIDTLLPPEAGIARIDGKTISLLDLVTQSSGIPSLPNNMPATNPLNPYADYTVPLMYRALQQTKLEFAPGRGYGYSNLGFGLLGHALGIKAGKGYEDLILERICSPLNMMDTRMTLSDQQREQVATPHDGDQPVEVWEDITMAGAGSFLSSAQDMTRYMRAHWRERIGALGPAMRLAVRKHRRTNEPQTAIGFGWHIDSENALDIVWHNGGSGGSRSYVAMLPDRQIGVCVLANWSQANVDELGRKLVYLLLLERSASAATEAEQSPAMEPAAVPNGR